jgi:hypothetical protein
LLKAGSSGPAQPGQYTICRGFKQTAAGCDDAASLRQYGKFRLDELLPSQYNQKEIFSEGYLRSVKMNDKFLTYLLKRFLMALLTIFLLVNKRGLVGGWYYNQMSPQGAIFHHQIDPIEAMP